MLKNSTMKHYATILIPLCVASMVTLGVVALQQQGFILLELGNSSLLIDGTRG